MRPPRSSGCAASRGMHLIEILVVTAVLAVLLAAGWPSLQALLLHQRAEATRFSLQAALATARSQAIMRRELIGLCASADGQRCGDDWSQGWIAYRAAGAWQPHPRPMPLSCIRAAARMSRSVRPAAAGDRNSISSRMAAAPAAT